VITLNSYIKQLKGELQGLYNEHEASSISELFVLEILNISRTKYLIEKDDSIGKTSLHLLEEKKERLLEGEPVQYILNKAWFFDLEFYVDKSVLIPRQETEILVNYIIEEASNIKNPKILDIGTGSGCIPISVKCNVLDASVFAVDISKDALRVAIKNANIHKVDVCFEQYDVLSAKNLPLDDRFDIIISNTPYVTESEKIQMHKNVLDYEPNLALFVSDDDPLLFYRYIIEKAKYSLKKGGQLWFEINENFSDQMLKLCSKNGFENNVVIQDLNKKLRFIKCKR